MDVGQVKSRLEERLHVEIWKPYLNVKSSTKTLYYEKSDPFAHLKVTDVILLIDPQLVNYLLNT